MTNFRVKHFLLIIALFLPQVGCLNTQGTIELDGKVIDEHSKKHLPGRQVIIQAVIEENSKTNIIECGEFSTDTSGLFRYTLRKVRNAFYYNFCFVGDSNYASMIKRMGLFEIKENAKYLFFNMNKLTDLRIYINAVSKDSFCDTLYLNWESENVDFKWLYPFEVENYGVPDNFLGQSALGLFWIGKNTRSIIKTKVFAGKMTSLKLELIRNNKRRLVKDTITCKRDINNSVFFKI
jgi:hypothetical protein